MPVSSHLSRVKRHPRLSRYYNWCWQFISYLRDKEDVRIIIRGFNPERKKRDPGVVAASLFQNPTCTVGKVIT